MKAVKSKFQVFELINQNQTAIKNLGVKRLGLFGSLVRSQARAESDVDFLVEFEPGQKTFDNIMRLGFFLEDLLQRRVELITPESLSPYIRPHVIQEVEYASLAA